jgi:hypothetical protein
MVSCLCSSLAGCREERNREMSFLELVVNEMKKSSRVLCIISIIIILYKVSICINEKKQDP